MFFATKCKSCKEGLLKVEASRSLFDSSGTVVLAVAVGDVRDELASYVQRNNLLMARANAISGLSGGVVMFLSTLGSFLGTILTSFFFIDWAPISSIIRIEGSVALLICIVILAFRPDRFIKAA